MDRKFIMFYKSKNDLGHVWIYGIEDLKQQVNLCEDSDVKILQVIEVIDYKEIDIDNII